MPGALHELRPLLRGHAPTAPSRRPDPMPRLRPRRPRDPRRVMSADAWLETLSHERCLDLLRAGTVGRVAVVEHDHPVVVPVNYRLVETTGPAWIAIRTRPG